MSRFITRAAASAALALPLWGSAQQPPVPAASAPTGTVYRSVFDGYRGYSEQPVQSWRAANDLVGRLGGWPAYARETQSGPAAGAASAASAPGHPGGHAGPRTP